MNKLELTYHPYELKLKTPFETSKGKISERKGFILSLKSQSGNIGIGDVSPLPEFGSETYGQAEQRIASINIDLRVGIEDIKHSLKNLLSDFNSHPVLRHGLEQAITNLICNERNITPAELLELKLKKEISVNAAIGFQAPDESVHSAKKFIDEGFKTIKIKTGKKNFDEDFNTIKAIRESVGDEIKIRIDSNGKWTVDKAAEYLNRLQEFSIEYAEQPVNSLNEFKELKQKTTVPLAADESIRDIDSAKKFISGKNIDYVILKPMMLGGLIPTLDIIEFAEKNNVIPVITSSFESAIGRGYAVIAAASVKADIAHGMSVSKYFEDDIAGDKYPIEDGKIRVY
jgi:o-succinylbenzoate synthase